MEDEIRGFCEEIISCLVKYGKVEEKKAREYLAASNVCECKDELGRDLLFHETPYYWAMHILHASKNPLWYQDPGLWPPPADYLNRWYSVDQ